MIREYISKKKKCVTCSFFPSLGNDFHFFNIRLYYITCALVFEVS